MKDSKVAQFLEISADMLSVIICSFIPKVI